MICTFKRVVILAVHLLFFGVAQADPTAPQELKFRPQNIVTDQNNFSYHLGFFHKFDLVSIGDPENGGLTFSMQSDVETIRDFNVNWDIGDVGYWRQSAYAGWIFSSDSDRRYAPSPLRALHSDPVLDLLQVDVGFESMTFGDDNWFYPEPVEPVRPAGVLTHQYGPGFMYHGVGLPGPGFVHKEQSLPPFVSNSDPAHYINFTQGWWRPTTVYHRDGRKIKFANSQINKVTSVEFPNGITHTYHYKKLGSPDSWGIIRNFRLQSITSNTGYMLHFTYDELSPGYYPRRQLKKVTAINRNIYNCDPLADQCSDSQGGNWPYVKFTYASLSPGNNVFKITSFENRLGHKTTIGYLGFMKNSLSSNPKSAVQIPNFISSPQNPTIPDFSFNLTTNTEEQTTFNATINGANWNYTWDVSDRLQNGEYTGSASGPNGYTASWKVSQAPIFPEMAVGSFYDTSEVTINGRTWTCFPGCSNNLISTMPNGQMETVYHSGGNKRMSKVTLSSEPGSNDGEIVREWNYIDPNEENGTEKFVNWRRYNKPLSYIDARGHQYDYLYGATRGFLDTRQRPASGHGDMASIRPRSKFHYTNIGNNIFRPNKMAMCTNAALCQGQEAEAVTTWTYNGPNKQVDNVTVKAGDGSVSSTTKTYYTPLGDVERIDGPFPGSGDTTYFYYDDLRRLRAEVGPDPDYSGPLPRVVKRYTYNKDGKVTIEDEGRVFLPENWDSLSLTTRTRIYYDPYGREIKREQRIVGGPDNGKIGALTQYSYDGHGRVRCTAVRLNKAIFDNPPTSACEPTGGTNGVPWDRITYNEYTPSGELKEVVRGYRSPAAQLYRMYDYYPDGMIKSVVDGKGNRTAYEYDGFNRLVKTKFPSKTHKGQASNTDYEAYTYDKNGNRLTLRKRDGRTIVYHYDRLNRVRQKLTPGTASGKVDYDYDLRDLEVKASFGPPNQSIINTYDALGRLESQTSGFTNTTVTSTYDSAGNRITLTHPDNQVFTFDYNPWSQLRRIRQPGGAWIVDARYDSDGRLNLLRHRDRFDWWAHYNPLSQLGSYDIDANFSSADDLTESFEYNPAYQVTRRSRSNNAYRYDKTTNGVVDYSVNGLNQYTNVGGVTTTHDANGNMTSDGAYTYGYDVENRLISANGLGSAVSLKYDPYGRLYEVAGSAVTRFVYDGDALIGELDGSNTWLRRYVHGAGVDDPLVWYEGPGIGGTNRKHFAKDRQGSVIGVASSGAGIAKNRYDPYGVPDPLNQGRFAYTGQTVLPELGLYYYKARIYSPHLGRFLQTDPIGYEDQMNLYAYVHNDPMNMADPTGEFGIWGAAVGAIAEVAIIAVEGDVGIGEAAARIGISAAAGAIGVGVGAKAAQLTKLGSKVASKTLPAGSNPVKVGNALAGAADGAAAGAAAGATSHVLGAEGKEAIGVGQGASVESTVKAAAAGAALGGAVGGLSGSAQGAAAAGDVSSSAANTVSTQSAIVGEGAGIIAGARTICDRGADC